MEGLQLSGFNKTKGLRAQRGFKEEAFGRSRACARYAETGRCAGALASAHAGGGGAGGRLELQGLWLYAT